MTVIGRRLIGDLVRWHAEKDRKPLLLRGARQVGKSWAVREWCRQNSLELVTINFEEQPRYAALFEGDLDVTRIVDDISAAAGVSLRSSQAVLFLDEIQVAPKAITALRYFYEKAPEICVVAAGSLIEFVLEEEGVPVGRVQSQFVFPFSFLEFLTALGKTGLVDVIQRFSLTDPKPISEFIHAEILAQLRLYYRIGGMPKVVARYLESSDMALVAREQSTLLQGYVDDIRKYARKADWSLLQLVFEKMGALAGGPQVKFTTIDPDSKSPQIRRALSALQQALILHTVLPTNAKQLPLAAHSNDKRFKLTFLDIGLLHHTIGFDWSVLPIDADLTDIADGRIAEQFVGQEFITTRSGQHRYKLHHWERPKIGSEAEVDFVIEYDGRPVPIEVKSGKAGRLKSLEIYIEELQPKHAFVLSQRNVETLGNVTFLPLYMACKF